MDWLHFLYLTLHIDQDLGTLVLHYGTQVYLILSAVIFLEIGFLPLFFLPGDPLLFFAGAYCASGRLDLWVLLPALLLAAALGNLVNYGLGRLVGHRAFSGQFRWLDRSALLRTHAFYESKGGFTFLLAPFLAIIRTFAPFIGGVVEIRLRRFMVLTSLGSALWVITLLGAGYWFGNIPLVRDHMTGIILIGLGLVLGAVLLGAAWRAFQPPRP